MKPEEQQPQLGQPPTTSGGRKADPGRVLLAKLISTLLGSLAGFFVANGISQEYTGTFRTKLNQGLAQLKQIQTDLDRSEQERQRLTSELRDVDDGISRLNSGEAIEPRSGEESPSREELLTTRAGLKADLRKLDAERHESELERAYLDKSIPEYRQQVYLLDLSSGAVVLILTVLGFALYPFTLRTLDRMALNWAGVYGSGGARSTHALVGFFAGINLGVVVLLAVFSTFTTAGTLLDYPFTRLAVGTLVIVGFGLSGSLAAVSYFSPQGARSDPYREYRTIGAPKLLDTSVLIDGRVYEIAASGFLDGCLVVTHSVLRELQNLADSGDARRRVRGRRGLELLQSMQEDPRVNLRVMQDLQVGSDVHGTDELLIAEASAMGGIVVTNDFNLNRVAAIRDVKVLNINALNNAVKPQAIPGEMLEVEVVDRGKQRGQGIAFLADGTMVVIEDGEPYIKQTKMIKVTSVSQTAQGRMIFGRVDLAEEEGANGAHV